MIRYIPEKITQGDPRLTKTVSEAMGISQNTVHSYITELIEKGVIRRTKRGLYELVQQISEFRLERSRGALESDMYAYRLCLAELLREEPRNVQEIWEYAFSEVINNVMDHSLASEIFDRYPDVYSGFTKTSFPLKNTFDGSPVSRSQAKRLCSRRRVRFFPFIHPHRPGLYSSFRQTPETFRQKSQEYLF